MFNLFYFFSGLECWLENHSSIYESSESKVFNNINYLGEISSYWTNDLLGINT